MKGHWLCTFTMLRCQMEAHAAPGVYKDSDWEQLEAEIRAAIEVGPDPTDRVEAAIEKHMLPEEEVAGFISSHAPPLGEKHDIANCRECQAMMSVVKKVIFENKLPEEGCTGLGGGKLYVNGVEQKESEPFVTNYASEYRPEAAEDFPRCKKCGRPLTAVPCWTCYPSQADEAAKLIIKGVIAGVSEYARPEEPSESFDAESR